MSYSRYIGRVGGALVVGLLSVSAAQAACPSSGVVSRVQGTVLVNSGEGFKPVRAGSSIKAGDQVMVQGSGAVDVSFGAGQVVTVPGGATQAVYAPGCSAGLDVSAPALIVGAAIVGGGIAAVASTNNGSASFPYFPVSP